MTVIVRDVRPDDRRDAEGFARVRHLALPFMLHTPDSVVYDATHAHPDAHYRPLLAEQDGEAIGTANVGIVHDSPEADQGYLNVYVAPDSTRRGAGSLLVRAAEEHLTAMGATKLFAWVLDSPPTAPSPRSTATARAAPRTSSAWTWRTAPCLPVRPSPGRRTPQGLRLRRRSAPPVRPGRGDDGRRTQRCRLRVHELRGLAPGDLEPPLFSAELTSVAVVDGRPAAFSAARTDGGTRYGTVMTGTARAHRGRGLAKLAKNDSLHRARAAGFTEAFTGNDSGNGPMIAINKWFGYEICATEVRYVRELG